MSILKSMVVGAFVNALWFIKTLGSFRYMFFSMIIFISILIMLLMDLGAAKDE